VSRRSKRRRQQGLVEVGAGVGVGLGGSAANDETFSAVELDFFKRAEELYKTTFESWEDFEPEAV
jgi:hypothetical protein